jgi:hypothetical protein
MDRFASGLLAKTMFFGQEELMTMLQVGRGIRWPSAETFTLQINVVICCKSHTPHTHNTPLHARPTHNYTPFHTQTHITPQARDKEFKDLLGSIIDTSCWEAAKGATSARLRQLAAELHRMEGEGRHLAGVVEGVEREVERARLEEREWEGARLRQLVSSLV